MGIVFDDDDDEVEGDDIAINGQDDDDNRNLNILSTFSIKTTHLCKV